eukprot:COSAG01_NODE_4413_length_5051_cov_1.983845_2_plen_75_part_00
MERKMREEEAAEIEALRFKPVPPSGVAPPRSRLGRASAASANRATAGKLLSSAEDTPYEAAEKRRQAQKGEWWP